MKFEKAIKRASLSKNASEELHKNFPCDYCEFIDDEDKDDCECYDLWTVLNHLYYL